MAPDTTAFPKFDGCEKIPDLPCCEPEDLLEEGLRTILKVVISPVNTECCVVTVKSLAGVLTGDDTKALTLFRVKVESAAEAAMITLNWLQSLVSVLNPNVAADKNCAVYMYVVSPY